MTEHCCPIVEAFCRQAKLNPTHPAIVDVDVELSYRQLDDLSDRIAFCLAEISVNLEPVVCIIVGSASQRIAASLGILKAGLGYVPLEQTLPDQPLGELINHTRPVAIITSQDLAERVRPLATNGCLILNFEECAKAENRIESIHCQAEVAYIRYTSGSTGMPKGVVETHEGARHLAKVFSDMVKLSASDRVSVLHGFWHTLVWGTLTSGATLCCCDLRRVGIKGVGKWIESNKVSVFSTVPTVFRRIAEEVDFVSDRSSVRLICLSGELAIAEDFKTARRYFDQDCVVINQYGSSELVHISSCVIEEAESWPTSFLPVGFPSEGVEVEVVNADTEIAGIRTGEIVIHSPFLSLGYWRRPNLTRKAYLESSGRRVYQTGDIGFIDAKGRLTVIGRKDRQTKVRAHRIQPDEIEAALLAMPNVGEAVVKPFPDRYGDNRLAAFLVGDAIEEKKIRAHISRILPEASRPSVYIELKELPKLPSGKIDFKELQAPTESKVTSNTLLAEEGQLTELEKVLADLVCRVLKREQVGRDENFFELGGDSLLATHLAEHIAEKFGGDTQPEMIFRAPTVSLMAEAVKHPDDNSPVALELSNRNDAPVLFCLSGLSIYQPLADALSKFSLIAMTVPEREVAVIGAQAKPLESLARLYVDAIRASQPKGPYRLVGLSFGGALALEVAVLLQKSGEAVQFVALFDSWLANSVRRDLGLSLLDKARRALMGDLSWFTRTSLRFWKRAAGRPTFYLEAEDPNRKRPLLSGTQVILFRADNRPRHHALVVNDYGWGDCLGVPVAVHALEGDHMGILKPAYVHEIAKILEARLAAPSRRSMAIPENSVPRRKLTRQN